MKDFLGFAAAAAAIVGAAGAAAAQDPPPVLTPPPVLRVAPPRMLPSLPPLPEGTAIAIPFAPPLATPLRYSHYRRDENGGETKAVRHDITLLFERLGDGYRMTLTISLPDLSPPMRAVPAIRILEQPVSFRLGADGSVLGMDREQDYWRRLDLILKSLERERKTDDESHRAMARLMGEMRRLPEAERMVLATRNIAPVLEMAGAEMNVGERREVVDDQGYLPFAAARDSKIRRTIAVTLERADRDSASFASKVDYDPEGMRAAITGLLAIAPPDKRAKPADIPLMRIVEQDRYRVSRTTGLTEHFTREIEAEGGPDGVKVRRLIVVAAVRPSPR